MTLARVTDLSLIVTTHEHAKAVLALSHQVNLHALDAIVRGIQGGSGLRGFAEVSNQMRNWTRELHTLVTELTALSSQQVSLFSAIVKQRRLMSLLSAANGGGRTGDEALREARTRVAKDMEAADLELRRLRRRVRNSLEDLVQLGLMARVLSSAAKIESMAGNNEQREELMHVSHGFAERSEQIGELIWFMLRNDKELCA